MDKKKNEGHSRTVPLLRVEIDVPVPEGEGRGRQGLYHKTERQKSHWALETILGRKALLQKEHPRGGLLRRNTRKISQGGEVVSVEIERKMVTATTGKGDR